MSYPQERWRLDHRLGLLVLVALLAFGVGCPGDDLVDVDPSISISISPAAASVEQGSSTNVAVTVTGAAGFTGTATIAVQGVPTGVTGSVSNVQSSGGTTTATVTVDVGASVAPGSYDITVQASGSGVTAVTATFTLTVTAAPSYELSATPGQLTIEQDAEGTTSIGIARTNFTGTVGLAVEGAPSGMTTSFDTNPVTGDAATLTVSPSASVAAGAYTLTVRGTATGLADRTATVEVVVTEAAGPDYVLAVTPSALSINQGRSEDADVTITRSGFGETVTLSAEGVPQDVTVDFSPNPVSGATSNMTVAVAATAVVGSYTLTVRGTATGLEDKTVTVELTVEEAAEYSLTLSPISLSVEQGSSGTVDVTLARTNFTEEVTLSLENAPPGVTGAFSPNPTTGDASVLTIEVAASATPDQYALTVRGTSASLSDETASLTLTVTEAPGFSLDAIAPISVQQGASGDRTVTFTRSGGFTGDVTVTVTDLPAGITATVDPVTTAGSSVVVTVTVAGTVTVGNYTATVRGNATGLPESTRPLEISVTTASGQQVSLDFSTCVIDQRPVWLAYQDGSGPWTPVSPVGDTYTFNVASLTAAVAVAIEPTLGAPGVLVIYATQDELLTPDLEDLCDVIETGKTVNGTVAGINPSLGEGAQVALGDSWVPTDSDGPVSFQAVPDGTLDLVGYKWSATGATDRMLISRDLNLPPGGDVGTIDFAGASAFDPTFATITVDGAAQGLWEMEYITTPSPGVCYWAPLDDFFFDGGDFIAAGAPEAQRQAGDFHYVTLTTGISWVSETFAVLQDRTISFGAPLVAPTITDLTGTGTYRRVRAETTLPSEYDYGASISLIDDIDDASITALATAQWLGGLSVSLEIPDLSGLAGFDNSWVPTSASTGWVFAGEGWTGTDCVEGAREVFTTVAGTIN